MSHDDLKAGLAAAHCYPAGMVIIGISLGMGLAAACVMAAVATLLVRRRRLTLQLQIGSFTSAEWDKVRARHTHTPG